MEFFDESKEQSQIKTAIVSKYFWAWARVIIPSARKGDKKIAYIDLFAGPGRYKDGTKSTPVLILEKAIEDPDMREMLVTMFNDLDRNHSRSLEGAIQQIRGIEKLKFKPDVYNEEVGEEIVKWFEDMALIPTLFFVDPWGYKGLSLRLINSVLKDWGCDCIFFFNYNRINMGLGNPAVEEHMNSLFGKERADYLREKLEKLNSKERESAAVEEIVSALKDMGGKYVLPFCFKNESGTRTSHHLIFVSKNFRGYDIMKSIMAKESSKTVEGVSSFAYCPADKKYPFLFEFHRPLKDLERMLLSEFHGRKMTVLQIYERHSIDKPFTLRNYKDLLIAMEEKKKIKAEPPISARRKKNGKPTLADNVMIVFS